jgi:hypothetical protein
MFYTDDNSAALQDELGVTCTSSFGLSNAAIHCTSTTTVDELNDAILVDADSTHGASYNSDDYGRPALSIDFSSVRRSKSPGDTSTPSNVLDERKIADVVIARDLDLATPSVQIQVLELLRSKRMFTRTAMHTAPKDFLFIAILSHPGARLTKHLNDIFAMAHSHNAEDGLPYTSGALSASPYSVLDMHDIQILRSLASSARITGEVAAYLHNFVLFLRLSRYITAGVTATATMHLRTLAQALAPLHGLDYVAPSLIALAARKVYLHRLVLATVETERTLQWGSSPEEIGKLLEGVGVEDVIEEVLGSVETPL